MSGFEVRCKQAREFRAVVRFVEASRNAPMHEIVSAIVAMAPSLSLEYFQIALSDCTEFRLESQGQIDDMLARAIEARAA